MFNHEKYDIYNDEIVVPPIEIYNLTHVSNNHSFFFNSPDNLCNELKKINDCNKQSVEEFKVLLIEFTKYIEKLANNKTLTDHLATIITMINNNPSQVVDMFIDKCYLNSETAQPDKFRKEIILGNEDFFMNSQYDDTNSVNGINVIKEIFEFKNFWKKLNYDTKNYIKNFLLTLCYYADRRFMLIKIYKQTLIKNRKYARIFDNFPFTIYLDKCEAI